MSTSTGNSLWSIVARPVVAGFVTMGLAAAAGAARAADPCSDFGWNVAHERALFATQPRELRAARTAASPPRIAGDRLYRLALSPQQQVAFAAPPGKKALTDGAYAGIVRLHVPAAALYRVSLSSAFWVDIVKDGTVIASTDFTGAHGCSAPRKIVQYRLPAGDVLLQLSGQVSPRVEVTVTREAASTPSPPQAEH